MIISHIHSVDDFSSYPAALVRALNYLKTTDFFQLEPGSYPIEGELMFAKVFDQSSYRLEDTRPEIHHDYIDVQFWPEGEDLAGYAPNMGAYSVTEADINQDLYFLDGVKDETFFHCIPGTFAVYFPWDVHRPSVMYREPITYRKVVIKLHKSLLNEGGTV